MAELTEPEMLTSGELFDRTNEALQEVRPHIVNDGGDVKLLGIEDEAVAIVELSGRCVGCPMSEMTVRYGIQSHLQLMVPEILAVDVEFAS